MEEKPSTKNQMPDTAIIKDYLYTNQITQKGLASKMGCSSININGYLNHSKLGMRTDTLVRMVAVLGGTIEVRLPGKAYTMISRDEVQKETEPDPEVAKALEDLLLPEDFVGPEESKEREEIHEAVS